MLVVTKLLWQQIFFIASILFSQQKTCFVMTKMILVASPTNDKNPVTSMFQRLLCVCCFVTLCVWSFLCHWCDRHFVYFRFSYFVV